MIWAQQMYRRAQNFDSFCKSAPTFAANYRDRSQRALFAEVLKRLPKAEELVADSRPPILALQGLEIQKSVGNTDKDTVNFLDEVLEYLLTDLGYRRFPEQVEIEEVGPFLYGHIYYKPTDSLVTEALDTAYPILFFSTKEEQRVDRIVRLWAAKQARLIDDDDDFDVFEWSIGGISPELEKEIGRFSGPRGVSWKAEYALETPVGVMLVAANKPDARRIYLVKGAHRHLPSDVDGRASETNLLASYTVRAVRSAFYALQNSNSLARIVMIGPDARVPEDLEQEVHVVDVPVPSREDNQARVHRLFEQEIAKMRDAGGFYSAFQPGRDTEEASRRLSEAATGLTAQEFENCIRNVLEADRRLDSATFSKITREKQQIIRKSGVLEYLSTEDLPNIEVRGLEKLQDWLETRNCVFKEPERAHKFGVRGTPRGVLLLGISGTGKSLSAKFIARNWEIPLLRLDAGSIHGSFVGQSEAQMRKALKVAESVAPCVLWIDEIEKGFGGGEHSFQSEVSQRVLSTLLVWMQEHKAPVFTVATANDIHKLPPEMMRAGRFDNRFFVGCLNAEGRRTVLESHLRHRGLSSKDYDLDIIAGELTHGFSGAEIEQLVVDSLFDAFREGKGQATMAHLTHNATRIRPLIGTLGDQMERIWALIEKGQVEPASDLLLSRSDIEVLIDPDKYFSMYCRLAQISGLEKEAMKAEKYLNSTFDYMSRIVLIALGNPDAPAWVYGHCNFPMEIEDDHDFKFSDKIETINENEILIKLIEDHDVEEIILTTGNLEGRIQLPEQYRDLLTKAIKPELED